MLSGRVELIVFTMHYEFNIATRVNREFLWGRHDIKWSSVNLTAIFIAVVKGRCPGHPALQAGRQGFKSPYDSPPKKKG